MMRDYEATINEETRETTFVPKPRVVETHKWVDLSGGLCPNCTLCMFSDHNEYDPPCYACCPKTCYWQPEKADRDNT